MSERFGGFINLRWWKDEPGGGNGVIKNNSDGDSMVCVIQMSNLRNVRLTVAAAALLLILASLVNVMPSVNAATLAVDQQCSSIGGSYLDGVGVHSPTGQTFIPTQSSIVAFALHIRSDNNFPTSMTANIISNGVAGVNGIEGSLVGSIAFTVPSLFGQPTGDWFQVQFPSGIPLTPGVVYALNLVDNSGSSGIKWDACSTPYTNGCGYAAGQCQANSWGFIEYNGDFSIAFSTTGIGIPQGASGTLNVFVTSENGFASPVTLTFAAPAGVTASFNGPSKVETSAGGMSSPTLTIFVSGTVAPGTYPFTVTASSGAISHRATLQVNVTPTGTLLSTGVAPDFISQPAPATISLTPDATQYSTVTISSINGFSGQVSVAASWVGIAPAGVSLSLPSPITVPTGGAASSTLTLSAGDSPSTGAYTLSVTATNGAISHTTELTVTVAATPSVLAPVAAAVPDFTLAPSSGTVSVIQGLSGSTTVIVNSVGGFSSPVTFSASWVGNAPTGIGITIPQTVTPPPDGAGSSSVSFTTTPTGSTGSFVLQVTGTSGSVSHSTDINLQVNTPGPSCIIATATYGSAVAPQVQLLRNFRDNSMMKTQAGSSFMLAFNAWYYSFSPPVANYIANHWAERTFMQAALYPLIGILTLSSSTFHAASAFPELAIILAGILASGLIGAFYLGLPLSLLRSKIKRLRGMGVGRSLERLLAGAVIASGLALALGELTGSSLALMISSATLVLSTILLSATFTSNRIAPLIARVKIR